MKMGICIFCDIVSEEVPSYKLLEDDKLIAILNNKPSHNGHSLIIPKIHYPDFYELPDELMLHINKVAKHLTGIIMTRLGSESMTRRDNFGTSQTVKHYHLHLEPNILRTEKTILPVSKVYQLLK